MTQPLSFLVILRGFAQLWAVSAGELVLAAA